MSEYRMPALGADMEAGTLAEWLVKPGDRIKSGDIIAVVETQKGAIEVEAFQDGIVSDITVPEGQRVPVGTVLAHIATLEEGIPAPAARPVSAPEARAPRAALEGAREAPMPAPPGPAASARIKTTPAARRRAAAAGIDLALIKGTGVEGSIRLADVEAALPQPAPRREAKKGLDLSEVRKAIAAAMSRSKREIPHYYLTETADLSPAMSWIERFNAGKLPAERILPAVLFVKAAALALREFPRLNGTFENGTFVPGSGIHVGFAIALRGGGLIAPAIRDADKRPLSELMAAMRDLVERARRGGLRSSELSLPTVTVTSVGERGAETVTAVIYPPQVAIVGFGRIVRRPWAEDDRIEARPLVTVSLAADHRVTDGHLGGLYLAAIARLLKEPEKL
jgi:pyruvate dehydrogenase E2 component (dihydrolipoamide acetyltransferase)